ncbi:MAG: OmpA family protein [Bacteroidetes bacterium]|nr:OmpA family protein [Bacteroidota bacterium]
MKTKINIQIKSLMIVVLTILSINVYSQSVEFHRDYFPSDRAGLKEALQDLKDGDKLFLMGPAMYTDALVFYSRANTFNPNNAMLNYKIGICYLNSVNHPKSIEYFEKAVRLNVPQIDVYYYLGLAYQFNLDFEKAVENYNYYRRSLTPPELINNRERIDKRLSECRNATELVKKPVRVFIDNMGNTINSVYDDYSPILSYQGNMLYFTTRRPIDNKAKRDKNDHKFFENIFVSQKLGNRWMPATELEGSINTKNSHDATAGISFDGQTLFVYKGDKGGHIYESFLKNNKWSKPKKLPKTINTDFHQTSVALTRDGKTMYFVSNRTGSIGGKDIWMTTLDEKGRWAFPVNMGATINTEHDEESIFLAPDGKTMYFSSRGHNSMGGFDIFKTTFEHGRWTDPVNLGFPINSPNDDLFFTMDATGEIGFFSSVRPDGFGGADIYMVTFLGPEKPVIHKTENHYIASIIRPVKERLIGDAVEIVTTPMTVIKGKITDEKTDDPLFATLELYDNETEALLASFTSNKQTGAYLISLPGGKNYMIAVKSDDYLFHSENINVAQSDVSREIINNIKLKKVEVGQSIVLNNIFFDTGAATLRPESYAELGVLYALLLNNPSLKIEISGHTDNVGSAAANLRLSEERARAVVAYLIERGVNRDRLTYKGYGFSKPIASNETAQGRQMNRRTEFQILDK